ncbi:MAG: diacylglycerol kinase family protein [Thermincola sp.]|jgi:diacylglycerol kinase|nr:diacylglycerol kinase family protein [Thermincola sp.]MDT3704141.1 diacylglycerol kinase family protein [Thermincola sp.]
MKEIARLIRAAGYAFEGLFYLIKKEKNTRLILMSAIAVVIICPLIGFTPIQTMFVFFTVIVTAVAEVLNTAIEITLDLHIKGAFHPKVKIAKDIAACTVLLCVVNSIAVFGVILYSHLVKP